MATIEEGFKQVLADFKKRLKPEEEAQFALTTLAELEKAANELQEKQRKSKTAQNLKRIEPFLQAMSQYKGVIEVFLNTSDILCFVWGPMKFMLLIASNWSTAFDVLLDAYKQIAENFPLLFKYRSMFGENDHMRKVLVWIFEDILKFHLRAWRIFSQSAWRMLFTATWKDFQESFKPILNDLLRHRELIESTASLEQIQESRDARAQFQASFAALETEQNHKKILAVVNWLSAADSYVDHEAFVVTRLEIPDTGRWILDESKIKNWLDPNQSSIPVLWLNGKPGAGKTILTSVIIDEYSKAFGLSKDISLAFFYCRDQDGQRNKFTSIAKAMLAQLLHQNPSILPYLYDECLKSAKVTLASSKDCMRLLDTTLQAITKTFLIIDGIDECEQRERKVILNFFTSAVSRVNNEPGKLRCLFVSQELSDIKTALHMAETLGLKNDQSEPDIKNFATKRAAKIQERFNQMPDPAREHVVKLVCEGADGMFLFAKLVLENLHDQENLVNVYMELHPDTFPKGFDQAYGRIVDRIFKNPSQARRQTAQKLLGWITFSKRPMKWHEIQGATAIDLQQREVNFPGRHLPDNIRDICGSLVEILPGHRVQLVHKTARHYLIHEKCLDSRKEEMKLAILCMQYLTFGCFGADLPQDDILRFVKDGSYAFLDYASLHWYHHLETVLTSVKSEDLEHSTDLGMAINEFFEMYGPDLVQKDKTLTEFKERCLAIENAEHYEPLLLLLSHAKICRIAEEKLEALGTLGTMIRRARVILEEVGTGGALDAATKQRLEQFYGDKWYKCSRHSCYYFHEGFGNERGLLQHTNRHEKPFCCTEMGCTRMYIGWSTEKELKKHMNQYHPDPEAFSWKFPHVKKPPAKFQCSLCKKSFSRASSLNTHQLREHTKDRPFICKTCEKGFVRKYELDRHESVHKNKGLETTQGDSQGSSAVS